MTNAIYPCHNRQGFFVFERYYFLVVEFSQVRFLKNTEPSFSDENEGSVKLYSYGYLTMLAL